MVSSVAYDQALNMGLMGVSQTGKGKEKLTDDFQQEKLSTTAHTATNSLANKQIVFEKEHEVTTNPTLLHMAAHNGDLLAVKSLLLMDSPINVKDQFGCTPLHLAASKGQIEGQGLLYTSLLKKSPPLLRAGSIF